MGYYVHLLFPFCWISVEILTILGCSSFIMPMSMALAAQSSPSSSSSHLNGTDDDRLALLAFKARITHDPFQVMSYWNDSVPYCKWPGITCGGRRHPNRVRALELESYELVGPMAPEIGNLSFLRIISLDNNSLHGEIPHQISFLFRLQYLSVYNNSFEGEIPPNISRCSNLVELSLNRNNIAGKIPIEFGTLSKLQVLVLDINNLSGEIPNSFANLSSLEFVYARDNGLSGSIPDAICQMPRLKELVFGGNKLVGTIPLALYNLSSLRVIDLEGNQLHGSLPPFIGFNLPNLLWFSIANNQFHGSLPVSISNLLELQVFCANDNNFVGKVAIDFGGLSKLSTLLLSDNHLGSGESDELSFINTMTNCTSLQQLYLDKNLFGGVLPNSIANFSTQLGALVIHENQIFGKIPAGLGNLARLELLSLAGNLLEGSIPTSFGRYEALYGLYLDGNRFTGRIPSSIGNLTVLNDLTLDDNHLHGKIPSSLGKCKSLLYVNLSGNNFSGIIPKEIFYIFTLRELYLGRNNIYGSLPSEVGALINLEILDVKENMLSGEIPRSLGACTSLQHVYMRRNLFQGSIPFSLSSLRGIEDLDISHNNFSGLIPKYLGAFKFLQNLNLSFNNLEGEIPTEGVFGNLSAFSVLGNNRLCGGIPELHLQACQIQKSKEDGKPQVLKLIITICGCGALLSLICTILFFVIHRRRKDMKESTLPLVGDHHFKISYAQLLKATDGFSSRNLIGVGTFGYVYKGVLNGGLSNHGETIVAVKVFKIEQRGASKSFMAECEALRNIRHRNLVKILTSCSSIDFEGNEFMALVYEFMPNGNLEKWLYPHPSGVDDEQRHLNLIQRLNVAIDIATALDYLHHHCHMHIIHCDLKPNNILLDDDLTAHLGDFGISKILSGATERSQNQSSSIIIKGSIGYTAPEYGAGANVSTHGDVYSYGILLLEMFTGKRPTDEIFKDNFNIHLWANMALHDDVMTIVDPSLLYMEEDNEEAIERTIETTRSQRCMNGSVRECLNLVIRVGVACSNESPQDRKDIGDVLKELHLVREIYLGADTWRGRI